MMADASTILMLKGEYSFITLMRSYCLLFLLRYILLTIVFIATITSARRVFLFAYAYKRILKLLRWSKWMDLFLY
ncbi:hypothetical protein D3C80_740290 [compost metagenome]